jgi:hypothetical protein
MPLDRFENLHKSAIKLNDYWHEIKEHNCHFEHIDIFGPPNKGIFSNHLRFNSALNSTRFRYIGGLRHIEFIFRPEFSYLIGNGKFQRVAKTTFPDNFYTGKNENWKDFHFSTR